MPKKFQFDEPSFDSPSSDGGAVFYEPAPDRVSSRVSSTLRKHEARLLEIDGVRSVGECQGTLGDDAIEIGVTDAGAAKRVPRTIDGISVVTRIIGEVDAYGQIG
ncbi:MAG: hypothetical protein M3552_19855 [Planctomycetota bacterium]|nr:hypothetical protein [Planctomycetota bacterium]